MWLWSIRLCGAVLNCDNVTDKLNSAFTATSRVALHHRSFSGLKTLSAKWLSLPSSIRHLRSTRPRSKNILHPQPLYVSMCWLQTSSVWCFSAALEPLLQYNMTYLALTKEGTWWNTDCPGKPNSLVRQIIFSLFNISRLCSCSQDSRFHGNIMYRVLHEALEWQNRASMSWLRKAENDNGNIQRCVINPKLTFELKVYINKSWYLPVLFSHLANGVSNDSSGPINVFLFLIHIAITYTNLLNTARPITILPHFARSFISCSSNYCWTILNWYKRGIKNAKYFQSSYIKCRLLFNLCCACIICGGDGVENPSGYFQIFKHVDSCTSPCGY